MSLVASGVNLPNNFDVNGNPTGLSQAFSNIGTGAYNQIGQNYGNATASSAADNSARGQIGTGPGSYATQRLGTQQGLDIGNLESGLGGVEGNTAYQGALDQRNYNEQMQLANEIGSKAGPSLLSEVFSGIGSAGKAGAQLYGAFGGSNPSSIQDPSGAYSSAPGDLSLGGSGQSYGYFTNPDPESEYQYYMGGGS